jgi:hypothetical protein
MKTMDFSRAAAAQQSPQDAQQAVAPVCAGQTMPSVTRGPSGSRQIVDAPCGAGVADENRIANRSQQSSLSRATAPPIGVSRGHAV